MSIYSYKNLSLKSFSFVYDPHYCDLFMTVSSGVVFLPRLTAHSLSSSSTVVRHDVGQLVTASRAAGSKSLPNDKKKRLIKRQIPQIVIRFGNNENSLIV